MAKENYIDLFYFDESHFGLTPLVPYAWQMRGETIEIPSMRGKYINVAAFYSKNNQFVPYCSQGRLNSVKMVDIFDDFARKTIKKTVVVLDNAPIHRSKYFMAQIERWQLEQDMFLFFLPPYSPELNAIEILWRQIKYKWLDFSAYLSFEHLQKNLNSVFDQIGKNLNIHFV